MNSEAVAGGYDAGYESCPCFWGRERGRLVGIFEEHVSGVRGAHVLDAGCGEGKNAAYLAERGALVTAVDVSEAGLRNAKENFGESPRLKWHCADIRRFPLSEGVYDLVIAYGLFHCLPSVGDIESVARQLRAAMKPGGYIIVCAFNDRITELTAHPGFRPTFISHDAYVRLFSGWTPIFESDEDLDETHPHNHVRHTHSMTRLVLRKP